MQSTLMLRANRVGCPQAGRGFLAGKQKIWRLKSVVLFNLVQFFIKNGCKETFVCFYTGGGTAGITF